MENTKVVISTWFRKSTEEWVGEIDYQTGKVSGIARYTGEKDWQLMLQ